MFNVYPVLNPFLGKQSCSPCEVKGLGLPAKRLKTSEQYMGDRISRMEAEQKPSPKSQVKDVPVQLMKNGVFCICFHMGASCICLFLERKVSWELSAGSLLLCTLPSFISVLLLLLSFVPCKLATEVLALRFEVLISWTTKSLWF